jgi:NRPS condensation-like uncharacterized protein
MLCLSHKNINMSNTQINKTILVDYGSADSLYETKKEVGTLYTPCCLKFIAIGFYLFYSVFIFCLLLLMSDVFFGTHVAPENW